MIISTREVGRARILEVLMATSTWVVPAICAEPCSPSCPRHPSWCSTWEASATSTAPASRL